MKDGTFSITNIGSVSAVFGITIINYPESAILGVYKVFDVPRYVEGEVKARKVGYITLSFDHRFIEGTYVTRFLVKLKNTAREPCNNVSLRKGVQVIFLESYDVVVIGGGPGGYPAAVRASQLGLRVALVEQGKLGGECVNFGCIPTKSMVKPVEALWSISRMNFIKLNYEIDFESYMDWVNSVSSKVSEGVAGLLRGYSVDVYDAKASLAEGGLVELSDGRVLKADKIIVSTGTDPAALPNIDFDGVLIHNNRTILGLRRKPSKIVIVGAGYIGIEFANVMAKVGVEVHLVEALDRVLPMMEEDFSKLLSRRLSKLGVKVYTSTRVEEVIKREPYVRVKLSNGVELEADHMLIAVGRKPNTRGIGLEKVGVELDERGYIKVDKSMKTKNPSIFAAGDSTGPPLLAHKAFLQAIIAAEAAAGLKSFYDPRAVPSIVFTDPEIVSVGLTEAEAKKAGYNVGVTKLPLGGLARALIEDSLDGFIKVVYDDSSKTILGMHIAGPHASELAGEAALAIQMRATLEDLSLTIHPHPTISEAIQEAAELALGKPKHYILIKGKKFK